MSARRTLLAGAVLAACAGPVSEPATGEEGGHVSWKTLAPGLDMALVAVGDQGSDPLAVLRIDPARWSLELLCRVDLGLPAGLSAEEWCRRYDLTAAINAGMFAQDHSTHVGYLKAGIHTNNPHVNAYRSVAVFGPRTPGLPPFRIHDLDDPKVEWERLVSGYDHVVQNLRLIKRPSGNRWSRRDRRWSEAALGEDAQGRALMIFTRTPHTMPDLNDLLVASGIGVVCAQHLEGGPEAQLYVGVGDYRFQGVGSYETGFLENDTNRRPWPVPNVIGIRPRENRDSQTGEEP